MAVYFVYIIEKQNLDGTFVDYIKNEGVIIEYESSTIDKEIRAITDIGFYYFARLVYRKV